MPQEGVILSTVQPLNVFGRLAAPLVPFRTLLDAMQLDNLLCFLDGTFVVAFAQFAALLVGNGVEGYQLRTVVFVAALLLQITVDKGQRTVIVGVVAGSKRMPEAALCRVMFRRTAAEQHDR